MFLLIVTNIYALLV